MNKSVFVQGRMAGKELMLMMADGNPGCIAFLCELMNEPGGIDAIETMRKMKIFGSRAYQLWNDCCDRNTSMVIEVLRLVEEGKITQAEIYDHVFQPWGKPFDLEEIRKREKMPRKFCHEIKLDLIPLEKKVGMETRKMHADLQYARTMENLFTDSNEIGKTFLVKTEIVDKPDGMYLRATKEEIEK